MFFRRIFTPGLAINTYLIGDEKSKKCVVIDPTRQVVPVIMQAQNHGFEITDILETHVHADFVSGSKELKHQLNGKPRIHTSGMGGPQWIPAYTDRIIHSGDQVSMGTFRLEAIHTPGHTPEHLVWMCYDELRHLTLPWFALTGDCVFVGSLGRPDLLGEKNQQHLAKQLYHSVFHTLAPFPDFTEILPAHGAGSLCGKALNGRVSSTLGYERQCNPYFKKQTQHQWIDAVLEDLPVVPPYFQRLKKMNVEGPPLLCTLKTQQWNSLETSPTAAELFLVDVRAPDLFAHSHIKESINIPLSPSFSHWAGWMLPAKQPIGLIIENEHRSTEVIDQLRMMGFDQPIWIIPAEKNKAEEWLRLESSFSMLEPDVLWQQIKNNQAPYIIDVRTHDEWKTGHLVNAHHIELIQLEQHLEQIPIDQPIACICASGIRASLATSLLRKAGRKDVANVRGGMQAWKKVGYPLASLNHH